MIKFRFRYKKLFIINITFQTKRIIKNDGYSTKLNKLLKRITKNFQLLNENQDQSKLIILYKKFSKIYLVNENWFTYKIIINETNKILFEYLLIIIKNFNNNYLVINSKKFCPCGLMNFKRFINLLVKRICKFIVFISSNI